MKNKERNDAGISQRIKQARLQKRLPAVYISKQMGLSHSICSQWEGGKANPATAHLAKLAKILEVSFEWLALGDIENKQQSTQNFEAVFSRLNDKQKQYLTQFVSSMF